MYDIVYMSKVFSNTYSEDIETPVNTKKVIRGGTGYAIETINGTEIYHSELDQPLYSEIEHIFPDYSLYPQYTGYGKNIRYQTAYGFLTRGCPRGCNFCHVAPKEGKRSIKVANITEFWNGQGTIKLSDPNILACPDAFDLLIQLSETNSRIEFNQGLDARLLTAEKARLLAGMKLLNPHFAMDNMSDIKEVSNGLNLYRESVLSAKGKWDYRHSKVFILTNFNTTHEQDMIRIKAIQECDFWPYVMIYDKPNAKKITRRLQRWCNNPLIYPKQKDSFEQYCRNTYKKPLKE